MYIVLRVSGISHCWFVYVQANNAIHIPEMQTILYMLKDLAERNALLAR